MGGASSAEQLNQVWFRTVSNGDIDELEEVVAYLDDVDIRDSRGWTAVMVAAAAGNAETLRWLLKQEPQLKLKDARGWTAAMHAASNGQTRCLELLERAGAELDVRDFLGTTPAMRAAIGGHHGCVKVLTRHGIDLDAQDNLGMTAWKHANRKGHTQCAKMLEESGARAQFAVSATKQSGRAADHRRKKRLLSEVCAADRLMLMDKAYGPVGTGTGAAAQHDRVAESDFISLDTKISMERAHSQHTGARMSREASPLPERLPVVAQNLAAVAENCR